MDILILQFDIRIWFTLKVIAYLYHKYFNHTHYYSSQYGSLVCKSSVSTYFVIESLFQKLWMIQYLQKVHTLKSI